MDSRAGRFHRPAESSQIRALFKHPSLFFLKIQLGRGGELKLLNIYRLLKVEIEDLFELLDSQLSGGFGFDKILLGLTGRGACSENVEPCHHALLGEKGRGLEVRFLSGQLVFSDSDRIVGQKRPDVEVGRAGDQFLKGA